MFFDSWYGDEAGVYSRATAQQQIPGRHLQASTGRTAYTLDAIAWARPGWQPDFSDQQPIGLSGREELQGLAATLTTANFLDYANGVGPP
jgi:hypothetical protein